jgi:hypothetical protein
MKSINYNSQKNSFLLISKFSILSFILFFVLLSCSRNDEPIPSFTPRNIPFTVVGSGPYSGNAVTSNLVIQNNAQWETLKNELTQNVTNQFTETNIDFNNFFLVAVIDNVRPNTGFDVNINNILEYENNIIVTLSSNNTGWGYQVLTRPFRIVKIPIQSKPFIFQ